VPQHAYTKIIYRMCFSMVSQQKKNKKTIVCSPGPKQISVFFYIYLLAPWGSQKGEGGRKGRVCPSLEYKFNSDNNRFLPRFRLKSISGYVSVRENLYLFFFCFAQFNSRWGWSWRSRDGVGRGNGRQFQWPPHQELPYLKVCVSATGTQHAHRGQRKGDRATLP